MKSLSHHIIDTLHRSDDLDEILSSSTIPLQIVAREMYSAMAQNIRVNDAIKRNITALVNSDDFDAQKTGIILLNEYWRECENKINFAIEILRSAQDDEIDGYLWKEALYNYFKTSVVVDQAHFKDFHIRYIDVLDVLQWDIWDQAEQTKPYPDTRILPCLNIARRFRCANSSTFNTFYLWACVGFKVCLQKYTTVDGPQFYELFCKFVALRPTNHYQQLEEFLEREYCLVNSYEKYIEAYERVLSASTIRDPPLPKHIPKWEKPYTKSSFCTLSLFFELLALTKNVKLYNATIAKDIRQAIAFVYQNTFAQYVKADLSCFPRVESHPNFEQYCEVMRTPLVESSESLEHHMYKRVVNNFTR